ncbi:MAG: dynamin family protein [Pseudomonadota bacterium]
MSEMSHPSRGRVSGMKGRRPRIALMGEFSAGKSTLSNLLLGARPLPEKVTATRLSPVWITKGSNDPVRVGLDGSEMPVLLHEIESVPIEETRYIRLQLDSKILDYCDLIDFPGISDPNMDSIVWERVLEEVDAVLWCTHATQAWRQSEAAVWETVSEEVRARSLLLVTRFDKLTTDRDRGRVLRRLEVETAGLFRKIYPLALLQALNAGDDQAAWEGSGAAVFADNLMDLLREIAAEGQAPAEPRPSALDAFSEAAETEAAHSRRPRRPEAPTGFEEPAAAAPTPPSAPTSPDGGAEVVRISPRRVRLRGASSRARPTG